VKPGINEFKLKLSKRDIVEIADSTKQLRIEDQNFLRSATYDDVHAAYIILALVEFMKNRHVEPGFEVVLSE
jgi:3-oxoacyl-[acyl-carrier-protein] synthase III